MLAGGAADAATVRGRLSSQCAHGLHAMHIVLSLDLQRLSGSPHSIAWRSQVAC